MSIFEVERNVDIGLSEQTLLRIMHFNGRFVLNLAQLASRQGADYLELLSITGKSADELSSLECKIDEPTYNRFVERVVEATGDKLFGAHAGEEASLAAAGLIVQIIQSSRTVKEALEHCCEYSNLGCSALPAELKKHNADFLLTFTPDNLWLEHSPESVRQTVYGYVVYMARQFESLTRHRQKPREVWFASSRPQNYQELERILKCPVRFGMLENGLLLSADHVEQPVVSGDYDLLRTLVTHANERLAVMEQSSSFYDVVKRSMVNLVRPEFPTIEQVAGHLNMSQRTFQRRLRAEGHSFRELIDELRKEFALSYLRKSELSVGEIAYLLGYSDSSAFIRSCRRWTGKTPLELRSK